MNNQSEKAKPQRLPAKGMLLVVGNILAVMLKAILYMALLCSTLFSSSLPPPGFKHQVYACAPTLLAALGALIGLSKVYQCDQRWTAWTMIFLTMLMVFSVMDALSNTFSPAPSLIKLFFWIQLVVSGLLFAGLLSYTTRPLEASPTKPKGDTSNSTT